MQAVVYNRYGSPDVLHLTEVPTPEPKADEVRIRIHATTVTAGDIHMRQADPFMARFFNGLFRPRRVTVLGFELAGVIDKVGQNVRKFNPGDAVIAYTGFRFGAYAEYICLPEIIAGASKPMVVHKPEGITFEQAAALPLGALAALTILRKADVQKGEQVMVYGASGSVGTYAVQMARDLGAEVTAVCRTRNHELVRSLGASHVIDYTQQDFTAGDTRYDVIFDCVDKASQAKCRSILKAGGTYLNVSMNRENLPEDLRYVAGRVAVGKLQVVIDKQYALKDIVEAHRYADQGHKVGNVVITV